MFTSKLIFRVKDVGRRVFLHRVSTQYTTEHYKDLLQSVRKHHMKNIDICNPLAPVEPERPNGIQHCACRTDGCGFKPRTSTNGCGHICKYMDWKGTAAMLTSTQSVGVAPEVNLRIIQARTHAQKGSTLALKPRADVTRNPKLTISVPTKFFFGKKLKNLSQQQFLIFQAFLCSLILSRRCIRRFYVSQQYERNKSRGRQSPNRSAQREIILMIQTHVWWYHASFHDSRYCLPLWNPSVVFTHCIMMNYFGVVSYDMLMTGYCVRVWIVVEQ